MSVTFGDLSTEIQWLIFFDFVKRENFLIQPPQNSTAAKLNNLRPGVTARPPELYKFPTSHDPHLLVYLSSLSPKIFFVWDLRRKYLLLAIGFPNRALCQSKISQRVPPSSINLATYYMWHILFLFVKDEYVFYNRLLHLHFWLKL